MTVKEMGPASLRGGPSLSQSAFVEISAFNAPDQGERKLGAQNDDTGAPFAGSVPMPALAGGLPSVMRIPLPGTGGLILSFSPPIGWEDRPDSKSTSTIFIMKDKHRGLRLDYGDNPKTKTVDYHWNRKAFKSKFPTIANHQPAGYHGQLLYKAARGFKYVGSTMVVFGAMIDGISIVTASNPLRRSSEVVTAWASAWLGARIAAPLGFESGTMVEPGFGSAVGGIVFGVVGAIGGYWGGEKAGAIVYDWAQDTVFTPLTPAPVPADMLNMVPE